MKTDHINNIQTITNPNNRDNFNRYLNDIRNLPPLSREEEKELFIRIEAGDERAIEKICKHNLLFVISIAKVYSKQIGSSALTLEDLIAEGNLGLYVAAKKFDYRTGNKFISYAVWWIKQKILYSIQNNVKSIRIPTHIRKVINKITKKEQELQHKFNRNPTTLEIFESMSEDEELGNKMDVTTMDDILLASQFELSLDTFIGGDGGDETTQFNQLVLCPDKTPDDLLINKERRELLDNMLSQIPTHVRDYFIDFYGIDTTPLNVREIGEKYDASPSRVKQLLDKYTRRLRQNNRKNGLFFFPTLHADFRRDWENKGHDVENNFLKKIW